LVSLIVAASIGLEGWRVTVAQRCGSRLLCALGAHHRRVVPPSICGLHCSLAGWDGPSSRRRWLLILARKVGTAVRFFFCSPCCLSPWRSRSGRSRWGILSWRFAFVWALPWQDCRSSADHGLAWFVFPRELVARVQGLGTARFVFPMSSRRTTFVMKRAEMSAPPRPSSLPPLKKMPGPILAPWWDSPAIAYWTRQSLRRWQLPSESARDHRLPARFFFLSTSPEAARRHPSRTARVPLDSRPMNRPASSPTPPRCSPSLPPPGHRSRRCLMEKPDEVPRVFWRSGQAPAGQFVPTASAFISSLYRVDDAKTCRHERCLRFLL